MILRTRDVADARTQRIRISAAGSEVLAATRSARAAVLDEVFRDWNSADRMDLLELLNRLLIGLGEMPNGRSVNSD